jgi:hypothetical protein
MGTRAPLNEQIHFQSCALPLLDRKDGAWYKQDGKISRRAERLFPPGN